MPTSTPARRLLAARRAPARRALALAAVLASALVAVSGCGREPTGPWGGGARFSRSLAFRPVFPAAYDQSVSGRIGTIVPFNKVRVLFRRTLGEPALDTVVTFPADADSMAVTFSVPLSRNAPADGEPLTLALAYVNEAGDTVFRGGPVGVLAQVESADRPPLVVSVPIVYSGPGANAKAVRIAFRSLAVPSGETIHLDAVALDSADQVIPNTPILWTATDTTLVELSAGGGGLVRGVRGAVSVVARLVTGQADTSALLIQPVATDLQLVSGDAQSGIASSLLAQPVVVRAVAADGLPVPGAAVSFFASDGGAASPGTAAAGANGTAATSWRLGPAGAAQSLTASLVSRPAVAIALHATIEGAKAQVTTLTFTTQPTNAEQGKVLSPAVTVEARDAAGKVETSFAGALTLQLAGTAAGLALDGTTTVDAVAGVATFRSVSVGRAGAGLRLVATAPGCAGDTSASFTISAPLPIPTPAALTLAIASGDAQSGEVGERLPKPLAVIVTDDRGKPVKGVMVAWSAASGSTRDGKSETDDAGIASTEWTLGTVAGVQAVTASIAVTTPANTGASPSVTFRAQALAGKGSQLVFASQPATAVAGQDLGAIVVVARDRYDNIATSFAGTVALEASQQGGGTGLSGSTSAKAVNGVATFGKVFLTRAGVGFALLATASDGLSPATSKPFDVSAAAAAYLVMNGGDNQSAKLGQALSSLLGVKVTDAFGNGVAGVVVTWRVTLGLGTLASSTSTTSASGVATNSLTLLGILRGLQQVTATAAVLPGQSVVFSATGN